MLVAEIIDGNPSDLAAPECFSVKRDQHCEPNQDRRGDRLELREAWSMRFLKNCQGIRSSGTRKVGYVTVTPASPRFAFLRVGRRYVLYPFPETVSERASNLTSRSYYSSMGHHPCQLSHPLASSWEVDDEIPLVLTATTIEPTMGSKKMRLTSSFTESFLPFFRDARGNLYTPLRRFTRSSKLKVTQAICSIYISS